MNQAHEAHTTTVRAGLLHRPQVAFERGVAFAMRSRLRLPLARSLAMRNSIDAFLEHPRVQARA